MVEFFKQMYLIPFKYGIEKMNNTCMKIISLIFNQCGKRLFKINNDVQFVEHYECVDNYNKFYCCPIDLKEIDQDFLLNTFKIKTGRIENLILSIPHKIFLKGTTNIHIQKITLQVDIIKNDNSLYFSTLETNNIYFVDQNKYVKNDLSDIILEIKRLLLEYLDTITIQIECIELNLRENIIICLNDVYYDSQKVEIKSIIINHDNLLQIDDIIFMISDKKLKISKINANDKLIDYLPFIYMDDHSGDISVSIKIDKFHTNLLEITNLEMDIVKNLIIIKFLKKIKFDNIFSLITSDNTTSILDFDQNSNLITFKQNIRISFDDFNKLNCWIDSFANMISSFQKKIITIETTKKQLYISQLKISIFFKNEVFNVQIKSMGYINNEIVDLLIEHDRTILKIGKINIGKSFCAENIILFEEGLFDLRAKYMEVRKQNNELNFYFNRAKLVEIKAFITFVSNITSLFSSYDDSNFTIFLNISKSIVKMKYLQSIINLVIEIMNVNLLNKSMTNVKADLFIDKYLIAKLSANSINHQNFNIQNLHIFLDPIMNEQIIVIINSLIPINEHHYANCIDNDVCEKIRQAMSETIIANNMKQFEKNVELLTTSILPISGKQNNNSKLFSANDHFMREKNSLKKYKPITQIFSNNNLKSLLIDDYSIEEEETNLKIIIDNLCVYLFEKLPEQSSKDRKPFISVFFKEINLMKSNITNQIPRNKYKIMINQFAIIDNLSNDLKWKYFIIPKFKITAFDCEIIQHDDIYRLIVHISPLKASIREETLLKLISFFEFKKENISSKSEPKFIEHFYIDNINIFLNFYPSIINKISKSESFTLSDFEMIIKHVAFNNIGGFDRLFEIFGNHIKNEIKPENIMQFIPNIKLIKPYAKSLMNIYKMTFRYIYQKTKKMF